MACGGPPNGAISELTRKVLTDCEKCAIVFLKLFAIFLHFSEN
jgi:hypothetical protein